MLCCEGSTEATEPEVCNILVVLDPNLKCEEMQKSQK